MTSRASVIRARPERGQAAIEMRKLFAKLMRSRPFDPVHNLRNRNRGRKTRKQVNMIRLHNKFKYIPAKFFNLDRYQFRQTCTNIASQHRAAILGTPHEVVVDVVVRMSGSFSRHKLIVAHDFRQGNHSRNSRKEFRLPHPV